MRIGFQSACLTLACCVQALAVQPGDSTATNQEASSYPYALALNAQSVRIFDVLLRAEDFHDISDKEYIRDVTWMRMRMDRENDRFLVVQKVERRMLSGDEGEKRRAIVLGASYDGRTLVYTAFNGKQSGRTTSLENALKHLTLIDIRFVGFKEFPTLFTDHTNFEELVAASKILTGCNLQTIPGNQVEVSRSVKFLNAPSDSSFDRWRFDTETLMPNTYYSELRRTMDGKPEVYPMCKEEIEWREMSGVFLPQRITGTSRRTTSDERSFAYEVERNVQFHWFAANTPLDKSEFSREVISTFRDSFPLIDPTLSGASSISTLERER